jgi:hypothetical protein
LRGCKIDENKEILMSRKNRRQVSKSAAFIAPQRMEFNPDYTQTRRDLGRIGILAGTFFVILVALSFFLK